MEIRAFVAIEFEPSTRHALAAASEAIRAADGSWVGEKWVRESQLHLTLAFLGSVESGELNELAVGLRSAMAAVTPFPFSIDCVMAKPALGRATMLWAVPGRPSDGCVALAAEVRAAVGRAGRATDPHPFVPHITLVRARRPHCIRPQALEAASSLLTNSARDLGNSMSVRSVTLFSSTLTRRGPVYEALDVMPLSGV